MLHSLSTQSADSGIRQDFLHGLRGAPRLGQEDIEILKTFHRLTTSTKHPKTLVEFVMNIPVKKCCCDSTIFFFNNEVLSLV